MTNNSFEIPQTVRNRAEQNVKQAHAVYAQFAAFVTKAMDAWTGAMPSNFMTAVIKDVQGRAVEIAKEERRGNIHVRRQDQQRAHLPRDFDASDPFCSRSDAGLYGADARTPAADRGRFPSCKAGRSLH